MALGKRCGGVSAVKRGGLVGDDGEESLELGIVRYARGFGRKRIVVSNNDGFDFDSSHKTPVKKLRGRKNLVLNHESCFSSSFSSSLEALPQDILIRILCGVDHEDLNQLSNVSKAIREATLIAKQWHFAYSTPKKTCAFRGAIDFDQSSIETDEIEAPNAPRQARPAKSRLFGKKLGSIAVNLFD